MKRGQGMRSGQAAQAEEEMRSEKSKQAEKEAEKGKKRSRWLYDGIIFLGVGLLDFAGFGLYGRYADRAASEQLYKVLNEQYVLPAEPVLAGETGLGSEAGEDGSLSDGVAERDFPAEEEAPEETPWNHMIRVNFASLKERNPDVIGWIFFENESISYPMQEKEYYEDHQYFQILSEGVVYRYRIFSYFGVEETETEMCRVDFTPEKEFSDFIGLLQSRSVRDTGIEVSRNDKVVTLLTCYTPGKRTLVNAVRVDSYEIETMQQKQEEQEVVQ